MSPTVDQLVLAALAVVVTLLVVALLVLFRRTMRTREHLELRLAAMEAELARRAPAQTRPSSIVTDETTYVITGMGSDLRTGADEPVPERDAPLPDGRMFADIVARESAIRALGLAHGLRRALAPETRNRIRFEMRREVKRARKRRRAQRKAAQREAGRGEAGRGEAGWPAREDAA